MVSGRLAASGDFRADQALMTSRPHVFLVRTSDDRLLGSALIGRPAVTGVSLTPAGCRSHIGLRHLHQELAGLTRDANIRLRELLPADESLERCFAYLIRHPDSTPIRERIREKAVTTCPASSNGTVARITFRATMGRKRAFLFAIPP